MVLNKIQKAILKPSIVDKLEVCMQIDPSLIKLFMKSLDGSNREEAFSELRMQCQNEEIISVVREFRETIFDHPCPQNRAEIYPSVEQEIGMCFSILHDFEIKVEIGSRQEEINKGFIRGIPTHVD